MFHLPPENGVLAFSGGIEMNYWAEITSTILFGTSLIFRAQRYISNTVKYLWWSLLAKIVNGLFSLNNSNINVWLGPLKLSTYASETSNFISNFISKQPYVNGTKMRLSFKDSFGKHGSLNENFIFGAVMAVSPPTLIQNNSEKGNVHITIKTEKIVRIHPQQPKLPPW